MWALWAPPSTARRPKGRRRSVGEAVQDPDGRPEDDAEDLRGWDGKERNALGTEEGEALGRELAEDDVEASDEREGDDYGDGVRGDASNGLAEDVFENGLN